MRIAQVSPLFESVPPKLYGGTERVVFNLTEELVARGHEVTLFASGDSLTSGRLVASAREALRLKGVRESLAPHLLLFEKVRHLASEFDIVHFHNEYMHFGVARELGVPSISTQHGRLDLEEYRDLFFEFRDLPLVSISNHQRAPLPYQNWVRTIHHGMPANALKFNSRGGDYLAFLGRISPDKGIEQAVEIALMSGLPLKIAAKVDPADADYYASIRSIFHQPGIEFIGEIGDRDKSEFLGGARALLFPINWPEPFGLVMIEALATGTPVIAFRNGSVAEVIIDGETGFIVDGVGQALAAVAKLDRIDRARCRADFDRRFTVGRMVDQYVEQYRRAIAAFPHANRSIGAGTSRHQALERARDQDRGQARDRAQERTRDQTGDQNRDQTRDKSHGWPRDDVAGRVQSRSHDQKNERQNHGVDESMIDAMMGDPGSAYHEAGLSAFLNGGLV